LRGMARGFRSPKENAGVAMHTAPAGSCRSLRSIAPGQGGYKARFSRPRSARDFVGEMRVPIVGPNPRDRNAGRVGKPSQAPKLLAGLSALFLADPMN
jgi:hypothetical protein